MKVGGHNGLPSPIVTSVAGTRPVSTILTAQIMLTLLHAFHSRHYEAEKRKLKN